MPKLTRSNAYQDIREWTPPKKQCDIESEEEEEEATDGPFDATLEELIAALDAIEELSKEELIAQALTELDNLLQQTKSLLNSATKRNKH